MATLAPKTDIVAFPLERPMLRARWRDAHAGSVLPYFIAGPENSLLHFACGNDQQPFELGNPVLLIGATGCGKTAIALHLAARHITEAGLAGDSTCVHYMSAIDFSRGYAEGVQNNDLMPLRKSIDLAEVLIIDDLQHIAEKPAAQDELASRIERRTEKQKPTIVTCHRMPTEIRMLRPRLASRILGGLTLPIHDPEPATQIRLLSELSIARDLSISDKLLNSLRSQLGDSVSFSNLLSIVNRLELWCRMNAASVTVEAISSVLSADTKTDSVDISKITQTVARLMGLKTASLRSSSRAHSVVRGRALAMYIARKTTKLSLDQIGKHFGGRDHSTVLHSIRKTEKSIADDVELQRILDDVCEKICVSVRG